MTLDVRLVLALPDYSTPQGRKDLRTLFMGLSRETCLYKLPLGAR
jgi:hypothetical protein